MTDAADDERFARGWQTLTRVNGGRSARVIDELSDIAPDLGRQIVEFAYGDSYARPGLAPAQRQLVTIGMLTAMGGCEPQLAIHLHIALNVGLTADEIVEAIMHTAPYAGFPRALNAIAVARTVFEKRGVSPTPAVDTTT